MAGGDGDASEPMPYEPDPSRERIVSEVNPPEPTIVPHPFASKAPRSADRLLVRPAMPAEPLDIEEESTNVTFSRRQFVAGIVCLFLLIIAVFAVAVSALIIRVKLESEDRLVPVRPLNATGPLVLVSDRDDGGRLVFEWRAYSD